MKTLSKLFIIVAALSIAGGPCLNRAAAQTNNESAQTNTTPAYPERVLTDPRRRGNGNPTFNFPGGNPVEFIKALETQFNALQRQYRVDLTSIATIPTDMTNVQVPKIRVDHLGPVQPSQLEEMFKLYNRIGEENPAMGKWVWEGPAASPSVLMLVPGKAAAAAANLPETDTMEVRVYQLRWITGTNLATVAQAVTAADEAAQQTARKEGRKLIQGRVVVDQRTASLIVTGSRDSLAIVGEIIQSLDVPTAEPPAESQNPFGGRSRQPPSTNRQ